MNSEYNFNEDKTGFSLISSLAYSRGDDTSGSEDKELTSIEPFKAILGLRYTDINNKCTDDILEGSTNKFYSNSLVDARIALIGLADLSDVDSVDSRPCVMSISFMAKDI